MSKRFYRNTVGEYVLEGKRYSAYITPDAYPWNGKRFYAVEKVRFNADQGTRHKEFYDLKKAKKYAKKILKPIKTKRR